MNSVSYQHHLNDLSSQHQFGIRWIQEAMRGSACVRVSHPHVHVKQPDNELEYVIALHEIGHVVHKHQNDETRTLTEEAEAWQWAIGAACEPLSTEAYLLAFNAMDTYLYGAACEAALRLPPPDDLFWTTLRFLARQASDYEDIVVHDYQECVTLQREKVQRQMSALFGIPPEKTISFIERQAA